MGKFLLLIIFVAITATCIYLLRKEMAKKENEAVRQRTIAEYRNAGCSTDRVYGKYSTEELQKRIEFQKNLTTPSSIELFGLDYAITSSLVLADIMEEIELRKAAGIA